MPRNYLLILRSLHFFPIYMCRKVLEARLLWISEGSPANSAAWVAKVNLLFLMELEFSLGFCNGIGTVQLNQSFQSSCMVGYSVNKTTKNNMT